MQEAVNLTQTRGTSRLSNRFICWPVLLKLVETMTNFIFQKLGMNAQQVTLVIDKQIDSLPKVSGGEPYLSRESNEVLQRATQYSKEMGDEYVSVEHLFLAMIAKPNKEVKRIFQRKFGREQDCYDLTTGESLEKLNQKLDIFFHEKYLC